MEQWRCRVTLVATLWSQAERGKRRALRKHSDQLSFERDGLQVAQRLCNGTVQSGALTTAAIFVHQNDLEQAQRGYEDVAARMTGLEEELRVAESQLHTAHEGARGFLCSLCIRGSHDVYCALCLSARARRAI